MLKARCVQDRGVNVHRNHGCRGTGFGFYITGPANHHRNANSAFVQEALFGSEWFYVSIKGAIVRSENYQRVVA